MSRENAAVARQFEAGTVLFREGDPGDLMYIIRSGRVKIYRDNGEAELVLAFLGAGEFLGEMALLEGLPRSASAEVVEPSVLIEVDQTTFEEMIRRNIEIAVRIMRKLASRVRALDSRLEKMMVDSSLLRTLDVLNWLMPQGVLEDQWIRVRDAVRHLNITAQAGVPAAQASSVMERLKKAGCLRFDGADLLIAHRETLDNYRSFLNLKREYEPAGGGPGTPVQQKQRLAVRRLMSALSLSPDELDQRQQGLADKYERYLELKKSYQDVEL